MPLLNRLSSGKIYFDDFTETALNPIWQPSPTDPNRYSLTERAGYLRMKHGDTPFYLLMDMPNRDFVFEIKNDYNPVMVSDAAGIVVFRDNEARIELIECYDPVKGPSNYTHMRMVRKGNQFTGYGSRDNGQTWEIIGSALADGMTKIGLVVHHPNVTNSVPFDVDYVKVFGDTTFIVGNLTPGMVIELLNPVGQVVVSTPCPSGRDFVEIDLTNFPIPYTGSLRVKKDGQVLETSPLMEIWGGDMFWYGLTLEVYKDGVLLPKDRDTTLGGMVNGVIEVVLTIKNPSSEPVYNVRVYRSPYFQYRGYEWVLLAHDESGVPGEYGESLTFDSIYPGEEKKFWLKVQKRYPHDASFARDHKFLLCVEQ